MNIPSGTVTFLFTDIEGSTRLSQEFPDILQSALDRHHAIMQNAVESNNGFVFKIIGDAFCCAFEKAGDAVKAAVDAQLNLSNEKWGDAVIKVRMGIHSGNAEWNGQNYMGYITLSRASRVMSAAYGEQIVISDKTYEFLKENIDVTNQSDPQSSKISRVDYEHEFSYRDLGERRLKDLIQPIRLFQIIFPGLREDFPPLKTLDARPNNLPVQLTSFIGREKEISVIKKLLSDTRLLTLLGPGGTGKTRISLQAGADMIDDFVNGVWFIELASLHDPLLLPQAIAQVLGLKEQPGKKTENIISDYLKGKEILIILDNCEHLIDASAQIAQTLLQSSSGLKIIATSREALHCNGERTYIVLSLSHHTPGEKITPEELSQYEAVRLFIERAIAVNPDFRVSNENAPALAQICFQLDGIPLAIELAAVRIKVLSLNSICERLDNRFKLLTGGNRTALPRQQTLKALIDWSYDLLSEKEKLLWQRLTIFSGGWTLEASEKICSDEILEEYEILDLLSNLTDKSLVKIIEPDKNLRYTMLETIKKYGDEKLLESGSKQKLQKDHFDYFYEFAEDSETRLTGSDQRECLKTIASENENIRGSLRWSLAHDPELALKMSVVLGKFWELRSHFTEGLEFLRKSLDNSRSSDLILKAKAIYWTGFFLINEGKYKESKKYLYECLDMFREVKYKDGEAVTLVSLGTIAVFESDYVNLNLFCEESLAISVEINNKPYIARNLQNIALGLMQQGQHDAARNKFDESLSVYRELNDSLQLAKIISNIGALDYLTGNYEKARSAFEESLQLRYELGDRQGISIALNNLGSVAYMQKDFDEAESRLEECLVILKEIGDRRVYVTPISTLGTIASEKGDFPKAINMFSESIAISIEIGDKYTMSKGFEGFAYIFIELKKFKEACLLAAKYVSLLESSNKNLIEGELVRFDEIKNTLKQNLSNADYEKYWAEGELMTIEEAVKYLKQLAVST